MVDIGQLRLRVFEPLISDISMQDLTECYLLVARPVNLVRMFVEVMHLEGRMLRLGDFLLGESDDLHVLVVQKLAVLLLRQLLKRVCSISTERVSVPRTSYRQSNTLVSRASRSLLGVLENTDDLRPWLLLLRRGQFMSLLEHHLLLLSRQVLVEVDVVLPDILPPFLIASIACRVEVIANIWALMLIQVNILLLTDQLLGALVFLLLFFCCSAFDQVRRWRLATDPHMVLILVLEVRTLLMGLRQVRVL